MAILDYVALTSIARFAFLFILVSIFQHVCMVIMYKNIFLKIARVPIIGNVFNRPTVFVHELFGHLIPALLSGSKIVGLDLEEQSGQVSVKYEKNMFGMASVFIAGFGPTFILPLIFMVLFAYLNNYDVLGYVLSDDPLGKIQTILVDIARMDELKDVLVLYAAIVIAPGAASSKGDVQSVIGFVRSSLHIVIIVSVFLLLLLYISYIGNFRLTEYGATIITNTFATFVAMYVFSLTFLFLLVEGWERKAYDFGIITFVIVFLGLKLALPAFEYPLIAGLICANVAIMLKRPLLGFKN